MMDYKCGKCGHGWVARSVSKPLACPKCKSYAWDKPKKNDPLGGKE